MRHGKQEAVMLLLCALCSAKPMVWSNVVPRRNATGEIMDAHDGTYNQWGGPGTPWYYYAMGYGLCEQGQDMCHGCGYGYSWIGVWMSDDLSDGSWKLLGDARKDDGSWPQQAAVSAYFRVHVIFNKRTAKYVLWVNVDDCPAEGGTSNPGPRGACYAVGTSSTPEGPFDYVGRSTARYPSAGDFDLLVDDDGRAYIMYTSTSMGHVMSIELLNDDYTRTVAAGPAPLMPGFDLLGAGACRDSKGLEPSFFTDEQDAVLRARMKGNQSACAAACAADASCTAYSWCDGDGAGASCNGACHAYMGTQTPPTMPAAWGWSWTASMGDATDVSTVTTGESWWRCQKKRGGKTSPMEEAAALPANKFKFTKRLYTREESSLARSSSLRGALGDSPTNTSSGIFGNHFVEAPAVFKRQGIYYALFGECCCFCGHGSGVGVYTAAAPLGPWTYHENIGCTGGEPRPGCGCGMNGGSPPALKCAPLYGSSVTKAQQNFVIQVHTPTGLEYVWTGDMWQSASDGIKAHDLQFWSPLVFVKDETSGLELPQLVKWLDNFTIDVL